MGYALATTVSLVLFASPSLAVKDRAEIYSMFQSNDALTRVAAFDLFDSSIPLEERSAALVEFWDLSSRRGQPLVRLSVLSYLRDPKWRPLPWSEELRSRLHGATGDPDVAVRDSTLSLWKAQPKAQSRGEVVPYLQDSADKVRERAVDVIGLWSDDEGREILRRYILDNATNANTKS
ncbi:MAG: hypothetical protein QM765_16815 [Myxococcales bacterium]